MADGDGASSGRIVPLSEEGDRLVPLSKEPKNGEWLINIMKEEDPQSRAKPLIQKVSRTLREIESNKSCFDPLVVSLGPYHHGQERLMQMENYKSVAARWFFSLANHNKPPRTITDMEVQVAYEHFITEATRESCPTHCYADKFQFPFNDFMRMMFLDGCFILYFIHLVVKCSGELLKSGHLNQALILRDMFLLENQIPYSILTALISLLPVESMFSSEIEFLIDSVSLLQHEPRKHLTIIANFLTEMFSNLTKKKDSTVARSNSADRGKDNMPFHLLDFLRSKLIGNSADPSSSSSYDYNYDPRSISELKAEGIKIGRSNSNYLKDIQFRSGIVNGHLQLPQLKVNDATKTRLLNLIAYEMCPDGLSDRAVTSYIWFLDSLIDHSEDVKELRSKKRLTGGLGSDDEIANLFDELAHNLTPNFNNYKDVIQGIEKYRSSQVKVWIAEFIAELIRTHFTSPWTVTAFMAAIFLVALTVVQTVYSVLPYYNSK